MAVESPITFSDWKQEFLAEIDALPHTTEKGDTFVQKVLQIYYNLSEADAIDATEGAGAGDKGVDAVFISQEDQSLLAHVVQGKYGTAGTEMNIYEESQKFLMALKDSMHGIPATPAIDKIASVLQYNDQNNGLVRYIIATVDPLTTLQQADLANVKKIANHDFGDQLVIETLSLENLYHTYTKVGSITGAPIKVVLVCNVISVQENAWIGAISLADMYQMLSNYARQSDGTIDGIYDRNIRKYLKRRAGSVNEGIFKTLDKEPERFIAYNNGITMICQAAQATPTGLQLTSPYIVNGCQTTRTLYDFMDTKFPGMQIGHIAPTNFIQPYKGAYMAVKILVVPNLDDETYANNITRFSNKQNAIRGKDFIALEKMYRSLKDDLAKLGYFLEIQAGEYDVLPKHKKKLYSKDSHVISSFEAILFYAASMLGKPNDAFGRSGDFMPGGEKFDDVAKDLTAQDLLVPWLVASAARELLGYTAQAKHNPAPGTEHRAQTRFLFLYLFFMLTRNALAIMQPNTDFSRQDLYHMIMIMREDYKLHLRADHPFRKLLTLTDEAIATYMELAKIGEWYTDRNSFLKREDLLKIDRITPATMSAKLKLPPIADQLKQISKNTVL